MKAPHNPRFFPLNFTFSCSTKIYQMYLSANDSKFRVLGREPIAKKIIELVACMALKRFYHIQLLLSGHSLTDDFDMTCIIFEPLKGITFVTASPLITKFFMS